MPWSLIALPLLLTAPWVGACGDEDTSSSSAASGSGGMGTGGSSTGTGTGNGTGTGGTGGAGPSSWVSIAGGGDHTCAVSGDGRVFCWGANDTGQLGDGSTDPSNTPVEVLGLTGVIRVAAGWRHTCAVTDVGTAYCWGGNDLQQLGDGTSDSSAEPVAVSGVDDATDVTCGDAHTCAIRAGGSVWCWGANFDGQLGDGSFDVDSSVPVEATGFTGAISISAGFSHSCAATMTGNVWCWGDNLASQLGPGTTDDNRDAPIQVTGVSGAIQVASGDAHNCVATNSGQAWCWGEGADGKLGDGLTDDDPNPKQVSGPAGVQWVAGSISHTCAVAAGEVWCWGSNANDDSGNINGKLGTGSQQAINGAAAAVTGVSGAAQVTTGDQFSCATDSAGKLWCWGEGDDGELGNEGNNGSETPVPVSSPQ